MDKIVLFSPNGYIGGFIKEKIQEEGTVQLYGMTRDSDLGSFTEDYDVMIYSAAVSQADAIKYIKDNVLTALSVTEFSKVHHIRRIIYLSTDSIYGEINKDVVTKRAIMVEPDMYGTTKYLAEKIIMESGIPYYILRLPGVVGGIWRNNFISNIMGKVKRNEMLELYNTDRKFNNIVEISDLTDFIIKLYRIDKESSNKGRKSEIFLLGNTEKIDLGEIVSYMKELYHSTSKVIDIGAGQRRYFTLDVSTAVEYGYSSKKIKSIIYGLYELESKGDKHGSNHFGSRGDGLCRSKGADSQRSQGYFD